MEKPVFDDYFKTLDKAGDRVRSVAYVFIVINIALLMYVVNVFVYPVQQYQFDSVNSQVRCDYQSRPDDCRKVALTKTQLEDPVEQNYWEHQLGLFYDRSVAARTFKAPFVGLETDRDLLWMIFPLIGMVSYFIFWSALIQLAQLFRFLLNGNDTDLDRLRLMQTAVVISAPLSDAGSSEMSQFYRVLWQLTTIIVFAIPLIVTISVMADQTNAIPSFIYRLEGQAFLPDQSIGTLAKLVFETVLLLMQAGLFFRLFMLGLRFGTDQGIAERAIARLEGRTAMLRPVRHLFRPLRGT